MPTGVIQSVEEEIRNGLFLIVSQDINARHWSGVGSVLSAFKVRLNKAETTNYTEFTTVLSGKQLSYLLLCGHGIPCCLTDHQLFNVPWEDVSLAICDSQCLLNDSLVFLFCCQGGSQRVADILMDNCPQIKCVIGTVNDAQPVDLVLAFTVIAYCIEQREFLPSDAVKMADAVTGLHFLCHTRD